ncbi:MAG TPA: hypothetical protein VMB49_03175 [Acidobacteriaceae bacterium]|nr:hypothetical protein [Acidobacteriaceae bacterium]
MSTLLHSSARRLLSATTAVMLLALLATQAASTVCTAQCVQHELGQKSGDARMTGHCGSMPQPRTNCAAVENCLTGAGAFCAIDLMADGQFKASIQPPISAYLPAFSLLNGSLAWPEPTIPTLRSSSGSPPIITPLRV